MSFKFTLTLPKEYSEALSRRHHGRKLDAIDNAQNKLNAIQDKVFSL